MAPKPSTVEELVARLASRSHRTRPRFARHAWEQDRRRGREARARGDDFRGYTYGDVFESPEQMLAELRAVISPPW